MSWTARRRGSQILLVCLGLILLCSSYVSIYDASALDYARSIMIMGKQQSMELAQRGPPKITIIVPWEPRGGDVPRYVPYFFLSVAANPTVDLLFVFIDKEGTGCPSYAVSTSAQELCLTQEEYYQLHVDFLCTHWNCSEDERTPLLQLLLKQAAYDPTKSVLRIFRHEVFKRWIDPATTIWAWCDVDTMWGNFERTFPWDIAHDFDIISVAYQPDVAEQRLLFTRGHMAFFQNTPSVTQKLLSYRKFRSLPNFLLDEPIRHDAEESEFSHFYFAEEPAFTFVQLEGMANNYLPGDAGFFSDEGTFIAHDLKHPIPLSTRKRILRLMHNLTTALSDARTLTPRPRVPTFTSSGNESLARVLPGELYDGGLWFSAHFAQFVQTGWTARERRERAFFMRREPGGPVTQRIEPRERFQLRDVGLAEGEGELVLEECLYKHFHLEKDHSWYSRLPERGLKPGQIMYETANDEAEIWGQDGVTVYKTGRDE